MIALNVCVLCHSPHKNVLPGEALIPSSGLGPPSWSVAELNLESRLVWLLIRALCTSAPREAEKETETEAGLLADRSTVVGRGGAHILNSLLDESTTVRGQFFLQA